MFDHLCHSFDSSNPCTWVLSCNCFTCRPWFVIYISLYVPKYHSWLFLKMYCFQL
jgi:hypothetical protein